MLTAIFRFFVNEKAGMKSPGSEFRDKKIHQFRQRSQLTAKIASLPSDVLAQNSKAAPENENNL
jgi:hypothetical protein